MDVNRGLESLAFRARLARIGLIALIVLWAAISLLPFALLYLVPDLGGQLPVLAIALGGASLLALALVLALAVIVPMWIYRAWANLHAMRLDGLTYSPGWAVGSLFVPVLNLFVPFMAMRELYNRSQGESADLAHLSAQDVTAWWACYVCAMLVQSYQLLVIFFNMNGMVSIVTPAAITIAISVFLTLLQVGAAWFLYKVIGTVTESQRAYTGIAEAFA